MDSGDQQMVSSNIQVEPRKWLRFELTEEIEIQVIEIQDWLSASLNTQFQSKLLTHSVWYMNNNQMIYVNETFIIAYLSKSNGVFCLHQLEFESFLIFEYL